ncbi:hypothetical protein PC117_g23732 [Phytophthora cactorum]|uniref:Uncharacterized protein n=1 Tax=Phytophthora cactorum TaxID=29920 RepID=A0A8T1B462_9STRA|nr:hypothetical protein PC117_g23732 [Phytophthora cactorum]
MWDHFHEEATLLGSRWFQSQSEREHDGGRFHKYFLNYRCKHGVYQERCGSGKINADVNFTECPARSNLELMNAACPFHSTAAAETLSSACTAKGDSGDISSDAAEEDEFKMVPPDARMMTAVIPTTSRQVCSSILSSDSEDDLNKMEDGEDPNDIGRLDSGEELEEDYIVDEEDAQVGNEDVGGEREEEGARTKGKEMIPI